MGYEGKLPTQSKPFKPLRKPANTCETIYKMRANGECCRPNAHLQT
jgi:hypothetical protein